MATKCPQTAQNQAQEGPKRVQENSKTPKNGPTPAPHDLTTAAERHHHSHTKT